MSYIHVQMPTTWHGLTALSGPASLPILHEWVLSLFPDVPSRIDENSTGERYIAYLYGVVYMSHCSADSPETSAMEA